MTPHHLIVAGASAGGTPALTALLADLPGDFPAAIFVVVHTPPDHPSALPEILSRAGALPALHPQDGDPIAPGHVYVALPDHHLLIENGVVGVKKGPKENRFRPSVDALFRSAAYTYGPRVTGVVLSGMLSDGTSGLWTIKRLGGRAVVQAPGDAEFDSMPLSALEAVEVDHSVPCAELGALLTRLVTQPQPEQVEVRMDEREERRLAVEVGIAAEKDGFGRGILNLGELSPLTCPECHGVLVQFREDRRLRYRCHTGHAYSADILLSAITHSVEEKAYQLLRALEEAELLLERLSEQYRAAGDAGTAQSFLAKMNEVEARTAAVREVALRNEQLSEDSIRHGRKKT